MDLAFLLRGKRLLDRSGPARLDHALLQATLACRTSKGHSSEPCRIGEEPLVELVIAGAGWRQAVIRQRGCFNRAEAGRGRNGA